MRELTIPKTITDYCETRDRALDLLKQAGALIAAADKELTQINRYGLSCNARPRNSLVETRKEIDRTLWRLAFDKTGFLRLMDATAVDDFERSMDRDPPEFSTETIRSTFVNLAQQSELMFARGLVNVFRLLSKRHRTNTDQPFTVGEKAILPGIVQAGFQRGLHVSHHGSPRLNDIDRVFKVLAGETPQPRALETALNAALLERAPYEDDYYLIRGYGNGNLHIRFKRRDLLDAANRIIAQYYGDHTLAAGGRRA